MIEDISHWKIDELKTASGTREKFWVTNPETKKKFLFKLPKEGTGEIWAEKVSAEVGKMLKLEMMDVTIVTYNDRNGLLLKNFVNTSEEEFFNGGDLLDAILEDFDSSSLQNYNLENVIESLKPWKLEKEIVKIIIFDNGASLGFNNQEDRIKLMFKDNNMFQAFTNKGTSSIGIETQKRPKLKKLLGAVYVMNPRTAKQEIERLNYLCAQELEIILNDIPSEIMSQTYKEWVLKLIMYRKDWLINWYKGALNHA